MLLVTSDFIDGLEDVVVSANKDGVFICGKSHSEDIKQYAYSLIA